MGKIFCKRVISSAFGTKCQKTTNISVQDFPIITTVQQTHIHTNTASFDFAHSAFTSCLQTEKQAYLWFSLRRSRRKCIEVLFTSYLTEKVSRCDISLHSPVTGKSAAALLLLWK